MAATSPAPPTREPELEDRNLGLADGDDSALGDDPQLDEGTLDEFMRDLVRETAHTDVPPRGAVSPPSEAGPEARPDGAEDEPDAAEAAAGRGADGLADRLVGWIGGLFGSEGRASGPGGARGAPPTASGGRWRCAGRQRRASRSVRRRRLHRRAAALTRAAAVVADDGARIEVRASAADRALAIDRGRAVALAVMEIGVTLDRIELLVEDGPDQARLALAGRSS